MWITFISSPPKEAAPPVEVNHEPTTVSKEPEGQLIDTKVYASIAERLRAPFDISRYKGLISRDIFVKPEKPPVVFSPEKLKLVSVEPTTLPFIYLGYIQTATGTIIGQVNWGDKTYFLKKGDKFKDYKVIEIEKKRLITEGREGQLILEFKKPAKGKELVAKLYNELDERTYEMRKGEELNNYKILDITQESVVLLGPDNKEWIIKKER